MYIKLTNASPAHKGRTVILRVSEIISVFRNTVTREDLTVEEVTMIFAPPHGTWEVEETEDYVYSELMRLTGPDSYGKE